jgi:sugar phosphate isomerase/epimerase
MLHSVFVIKIHMIRHSRSGGLAPTALLRLLLSLAFALAVAARAQSNSFFAFCMDTHDAKKRSLAEQASLLKELGYDGAGHLWLDHVPARLQTLDAAGLKLFQVYLRVDLASGDKPPYDARLKDILPLLKDRGAMLAVLVAGGKPSDTSRDARAVEVVREIADLARPHDVKVALYPHVNDWLERVEDALRVARQVERPNVGVMFNLCHWLKTDTESNLQPLLQAVCPHLLCVSINGSDRGAEVRAGKGRWIEPLDTGDLDLLPLLRTLKDLGYTGPIGLQCYGIPGDARDHLTRSRAAWKKLRQRLTSAN